MNAKELFGHWNITYEGTGHWFFEKDRKDAYNAEGMLFALGGF